MSSSYRWERVTNSHVLSPNPVNIGTVMVTPDSGTVGKVVLYDGESDNDPVLVTITTGNGQTKVVHMQPYLETFRGLYCKIIENVAEVLVYYGIERE